MGLVLLAACSGPGRSAAGEVVLFTALDPVFSEPIVREFEKRTGLRVKLVTDTEAAKTVGLVNRLIARKEHPEADVFWNNELGQTLVLKAAGVLAPYVPAAAADIPADFKDPDGWWTGFAARARVILYRTDQVAPGQAPRTLADLAQPRFRGQVALARPLFGTTFTHAAALFATAGDEPAQNLLLALKQNGAVWVAGNAMARDLVVRGERAVCLTDSDDAHGAWLKGAPVAMVYPDQEAAGALVIPNSTALIRGGPNPENARKLIEFLVSAEVEGLLAQSESAQIPVRPGVRAKSDQFRLDRIKVLRVDWAAVARKFPAVKAFTEAQLLGD